MGVARAKKIAIPKKAKRKTKNARIPKVAAAVLTGTPLAAVARQEGVSRQAVHRDLPQARQIISDLVDSNISDISVLFSLIVRVIREAADARRAEKLSDGTLVDLGPDHYARLAAAKRYIELVTAGRPAPKAQEETQDRGVTWAQL